MNRRGLKQASRQCMLDAEIRPARMTFLFLLCLYLVIVPCDILSYLLESSLDKLSGFSAFSVRSQYLLWTILMGTAASLVSIVWSAGYTAYTMHLSRGKPAVFDDFFTGFRMIGKILCLELLQIFLIWLWSMLFIIPGIVAAYRYRMALFVQLDHPEYSASQCIDVSKQLTYGHKSELFALDLSFWWYYVLDGLSSLAMALFNRDLLPLKGWTGFLTAYFAGLLVSFIVSVPWQAYVQTTEAHAYNWLRSLDQTAHDEAQAHFDSPFYRNGSSHGS